jgi:hypothetical protein
MDHRGIALHQWGQHTGEMLADTAGPASARKMTLPVEW